MVKRIVTLRRPARAFLSAVSVAGLMACATLSVVTRAEAAPDSAIVVDAKTGKVLYSSNADAERYPASLTKMMTLYMLFESLEAGRNSLDTKISVSAHCASRPPSKLGFKPGQTIGARDAILSLVTRSANDVACAIGEHLAGTESAFGRAMTKKARSLGMSKTTFRNASGLPDSEQVTTARDMALLGRALQDHFPEKYKYFSTRSFKWKGHTIGNHNRLLGRVDGVDGIKTGYTRASGFNLVTSVTRNNRHVVGVVIGGETSRWRDNHMAELIKKYTPRASNGPQIVSIGRGIPAYGALAYANASAPIPPQRPMLDPDPVVTASVVGANSIFALAAVEQGDANFEELDVAALEAMAASKPIPAAAAKAVPTAAAKPILTAATNPVAEPPAPQPITAPSAQMTSGWKIQLAATPTQSSAEKILDRARAKVPDVLADATPYTETVVKEDVTLYRARFGGFSDKESARAACAKLTKHDFACLALSS